MEGTITIDQLTPQQKKLHTARKLMLILGYIAIPVVAIAFYAYIIGQYRENLRVEPSTMDKFSAAFMGIMFGVWVGTLIVSLTHIIDLYKKLYRGIKKATNFIVILPLVGWLYLIFFVAFIPLVIVIFVAGLGGWVYMLIDTVRLIRKRPLLSKKELEATEPPSE